ncbi:kinase-like domain-containing protein [Suillus americanus]|nr:kinase-like domain-containing protein [Suillus americanus]
MASISTNAGATRWTLMPSMALYGHSAYIQSISYFPDGQRMISVSEDKTARQWDLKAGKEIKKSQNVLENEVEAVAVSRNGRWVVTAGGDFDGSYGELKAYEVETGIVKTFEGHSKIIFCIDISVDECTLLASGSSDRTARIWNLDTGELVTGPFECTIWISAVRFSPDLKKLAVKLGSGACLQVWDIQSGNLDASVGSESNDSGTLSRAPMFWTNNIIAAFSFTRGDAQTIYEFDASTLKTVEPPFEGHTKGISSLALSFDGALLASAAGDDTIKLWAFESRQLLASFDVQDPRTLVLSPDSHQLAYTTYTKDDDDKIHVCNTPLDVLAQTSTRVRKKSVSSDLLNVRHQDTLHSNGGRTADLPSTTISPATALPPSPQIPFSAVGSRPLPQSHSNPGELLPSSSHTHTIFSARNVESDDLPPEATLQDLSKYITKDGDYPVARGGFGEIWKCIYHKDHSSVKVAVKALQVYADDQLGEAKTKKVKRIKHELRICANLNHPNILPVFGYTYGFGPFIAIVSPWAENGNLTVYLEREGTALALVRRFQLLRDIIAGLRYLHTNRVIHGDFTGVSSIFLMVPISLRCEPQPNVLIHGDDTACVADFGLSLMYSEVISASQASWTSTLKGNTRWMAPELLVSEREDGSPTRPSEQSDIFSFGGIMLQVLTNKIPYYYLPNDAAIVLCIARSEKPSRARYTELPEKYWTFIEKCWSTDPRDRQSTEGADTAIRNEFYSLSRPS